VRREENLLLSFAPRDISMILALAVEAPVSVHTEGSLHLHPAIADTTLMHLRFASPAALIFMSPGSIRFKDPKLVVIGKKAMAVFNDSLPWH
jgi:UDP-2-acetamido-3-amino-2,3-dideoxy-glucuronate N-acetyltransferase